MYREPTSVRAWSWPSCTHTPRNLQQREDHKYTLSYTWCWQVGCCCSKLCSYRQQPLCGIRSWIRKKSLDLTAECDIIDWFVIPDSFTPVLFIYYQPSYSFTNNSTYIHKREQNLTNAFQRKGNKHHDSEII